jgi:hypothetical protein
MTTDKPLPALGGDTTAIIHDNLGIVLTYALSKQALDEYRGWLTGKRWHCSDRVLRKLPEQRANRAIIELAVMFRALDDAREITNNDYVVGHPYVVYHPAGYVYGKLYGLDGNLSRFLSARYRTRSSTPRASSGTSTIPESRSSSVTRRRLITRSLSGRAPKSS